MATENFMFIRKDLSAMSFNYVIDATYTFARRGTPGNASESGMSFHRDT